MLSRKGGGGEEEIPSDGLSHVDDEAFHSQVAWGRKGQPMQNKKAKYPPPITHTLIHRNGNVCVRLKEEDREKDDSWGNAIKVNDEMMENK